MTDTLRAQLQASLGSAYVVGPELGGGGMSRVFAADDVALGRRIVIKVLAPDLAAGLNIERFKREIRVSAALQHPHIVPVFQAGEAGGLLYFTMPLANGRSLAARLADSGRFPIAEAVSILRDIAKALEFAHLQGVVHRDIKPGNILIASNAAVVTDFGIAKALSAARGTEQDHTLTQTGTSLGTPAYMAPEQSAADPMTDHRADIYAFGVVAYELLTGAPPFAGWSPQKFLAAQMAERPQSLETARVDVPPALAALIMRCLEKDPSARPQSATELLRVLETVTTSGAMVDQGMLLRPFASLGAALAVYGASFLIIVLGARVAMIEIGLPDWVFPAAVVIMLTGPPVVLFTAYTERTVRREWTRTPARRDTSRSVMTALALKAGPHVTWRRTALGGAVALAVLVLTVITYMAMRAAGIGPIGSLLGTGAIHQRDRIVVADFRAPGDTSLADVAGDAVRTDLGESSVISLLAPSEVVSILRLMQRPPPTRLDVPLAAEVAARAGAKALVDGSIAAVGSGYLVNLRLLAPSGAELAAFHGAADGPHDLLPTLDRLARRLRAKIGESLKSVAADAPLEQVTTPSLDALRKYGQGTRANNDGDYDRAIALLREAVALDTEFAMGYRALGLALSNKLGNRPSIDSALTAAYRHRDRLTRRERNLAIASYYDVGPGQDRAKAARAYEAVLAADSLDWSADEDLALLYETERRYASAEVLLRRLIASGGGAANTLYALARVQTEAGDTNAARRTGAILQDRFPNAVLTPFVVVGRLYDQNRVDSLELVLSQIARTGTAGQIGLATDWLAGLAVLRGHLAAWPRLQAASHRAAGEPASMATALEDSIARARFDVVLRHAPARAIARLDAIVSPASLLAASGGPFLYVNAAWTYAVAARPERARLIIGWYGTRAVDSLKASGHTPFLHAALGEIALAEHRPREALREFVQSDSLGDGEPSSCDTCFPLSAGRAYDVLGNADSAILMWARYQSMHRIGDFPYPLDVLFRPLVYKRLGELYETKGDRARAIANFDQFITLWRTADPDFQPMVAEARRRLARLAEEPTGASH